MVLAYITKGPAIAGCCRSVRRLQAPDLNHLRAKSAMVSKPGYEIFPFLGDPNRGPARSALGGVGESGGDEVSQIYPALTYFRQLCASLNPSTSRAFRFDSGASSSPSSRVIGTLGQQVLSTSRVGMSAVTVSLTALKT